jgi:hypothetical protein
MLNARMAMLLPSTVMQARARQRKHLPLALPQFCTAMQEFMESLSANGPLREHRLWLERELQKRVRHLQSKTGHKHADLEHLADREYVEIMARHQDSLQKQVRADAAALNLTLALVAWCFTF